MKIGIFTIFDAYNYGSYLQAFATQQYLNSLGHDVYIIDVRTTLKSHIAQKYFAKSLKRTILKLKRWNAYRKDWTHLRRVNILNYPNLDLAIIGSDEVWNISNESFDHAPQYYGKDIRANNIIGYAPSLGFSTASDYSIHKDFIDSILLNISWVGVRDMFTREFLSQIGYTNSDMVCDPTLFLNDKWSNIEEKYPISEPYIIYYSYLDETPFKDLIVRFAKTHHLKIYSVGFDYKWCDEQLIVSPRQFLYLMHHASCIVTSTFHGTVFSTLYNKKFVLIHPAKKAVDYLEQIGISREVADANSYGAFENMLFSDIDYSLINKRIESWKDKSLKLLIDKIESTSVKI